MKTREDFRRDDVRAIFKKRLCAEAIRHKPLMIRMKNILSDKTIVDLSFLKEEGSLEKEYKFKEIMSSGFVDAVYKICYNTFKEEYTSLANISLVDVLVKPIFSMSNSSAKTDAKTDVVFRLQTKEHGVSEFTSVLVLSCILV